MLRHANVKENVLRDIMDARGLTGVATSSAACRWAGLPHCLYFSFTSMEVNIYFNGRTFTSMEAFGTFMEVNVYFHQTK